MKLNRITRNTFYDWAAQLASGKTGGTPTQSGAIEFSPENLKFWMGASPAEWVCS